MTLQYRPRRIRSSDILRDLTAETILDRNKLIMPHFITEGKGIREKISSMEGIERVSVENLLKDIEVDYKLGIRTVLLFGIPDKKDSKATEAYSKDGIIQKAIGEIKDKFDDLLVISDVCLCEYMDHGHCGIIIENQIDNDATLEILARTAVSHAAAGADMVAPSDMMDGRVGEIRAALDEENFYNIPIMSYAVKYASAFYGPFRDAADCAPQEGDRRGYQMDPANSLEALREATLDVEEGADIIMVKPAVAYLDIISKLRDEFDLPIAAYHVSGEYAMIKAAGANGWIDEEKVMEETLLSIKRAGAEIILTYFAKDMARLLQG